MKGSALRECADAGGDIVGQVEAKKKQLEQLLSSYEEGQTHEQKLNQGKSKYSKAATREGLVGWCLMQIWMGSASVWSSVRRSSKKPKQHTTIEMEHSHSRSRNTFMWV